MPSLHTYIVFFVMCKLGKLERLPQILINMLFMKRFYMAVSLVVVLLYMATLSLATTSSNFTDLSLLAFKSEIKLDSKFFFQNPCFCLIHHSSKLSDSNLWVN